MKGDYRMAWGYEKCFIIEHDNTLKRRINCKDCCYYESDDKSCMKRPLYLPVDGYNSWRNCKYFELNSSTSHYEEKQAQYARVLSKKSNVVKTGETLATKGISVTNDKLKVEHVKHIYEENKKYQVCRETLVKKDISVKSDRLKVENVKHIYKGNKKYQVYEVIAMPKGIKFTYEYVEIFLQTNKKRLIQVGFDDVNNFAYVNKNVYTPEAIECVKKLLQ